MKINLWYSKHLQEWRWTLCSEHWSEQHSGQRKDLRIAMNDIANTVEYIISKSKQE